MWRLSTCGVMAAPPPVNARIRPDAPGTKTGHGREAGSDLRGKVGGRSTPVDWLMLGGMQRRVKTTFLFFQRNKLLLFR